jgi:hypothetical protein
LQVQITQVAAEVEAVDGVLLLLETVGQELL